METVLLYQIKGTKTAALLKPVLLKLGIRVRIVEPEQYLQSIGFLAGNKAFAVGTRIVWIFGIFPQHRSLYVLFISYPGSWIITIIMQVICYLIVRKKVHSRAAAV